MIENDEEKTRPWGNIPLYIVGKNSEKTQLGQVGTGFISPFLQLVILLNASPRHAYLGCIAGVTFGRSKFLRQTLKAMTCGTILTF